MQKDGELVVDCLRNELKAKIIGVHGESLGGMVACYLAYKKNLDFLCCDRTFSSLSEVAHYSFGKFFKIMFRTLTTNWDKQLAQYYVNAKCYKIITFDPKDEVIPYLASIKNSVSQYFYSNVYNNN